MNEVIGGWQISFTNNWASGLPFTPSLSSCPGNSSGVCRPDKGVGGFNLGASGLIHPAGGGAPYVQYFTPVLVGGTWLAPPTGVIGNSGFDSLYGPSDYTAQAAIMKNFQLTERFKFSSAWTPTTSSTMLLWATPTTRVAAGTAWRRSRLRTLAVAVAGRFKTSCLAPRCVSCSLACICSSNSRVEGTISQEGVFGLPPSFAPVQLCPLFCSGLDGASYGTFTNPLRMANTTNSAVLWMPNASMILARCTAMVLALRFN